MEDEHLAEPEVVLPEVPSADDRHLVVGDHQLVVHAVVPAVQAADELERTGHGGDPPGTPGVHDPDGDGRLPVDRGEMDLPTGQLEVVHQDPDPDAALRGRDDPLREEQAGVVLAVPEVVLDVEGPPGRVDERQAPVERVLVPVQEDEPRGVRTVAVPDRRHDGVEAAPRAGRDRVPVRGLRGRAREDRACEKHRNQR